ncbi:hypothetical protein HKX48_004721 [Thoreauomyces humboldtii]|nr:hypothetical protein HKX48_004721 [Thoreauomyces humboldtii]
MLAELEPQLGSAGPLVRRLTKELYESVYSHDFTSTDTQPFVARLPYFNAVNRVVQARQAHRPFGQLRLLFTCTELIGGPWPYRSDEGVKTHDAVAELEQKIKFRDYDAQMLQRKNLALKQEISNGEANEQRLRKQIADLRGQIEQQENEKMDLRATHGSKEDLLKRHIDQLQSSLAQSNQVIEKLTVFKSAYDEPTDDGTYEEEHDQAKQQLVIDSQGMVEYDLYQAQRLEEQFADILNWQLDDYEAALAQLHKKQEILSGVTTGTEERDESYRLELSEIVSGFRKRIADLLEEQQLLRKHVQGLKIVLSNYAGDRLMSMIQRTADDALRKYAFAMQYSEDRGQTYTPCRTMQYCSKCGERTVVCPHRTLTSEVVPLPVGVTHLRFTHPSLRLRTNFNRQAFEADLPVRLAMLEFDPGVTEDENEEATPAFRRLWKEYYETRSGAKPRAPRAIALTKLLGIIDDIYDQRWAYETELDRVDSEDPPALSRFEDFFYERMQERYQISDIARKAIHDLFTSLQLYEESNSIVNIFVRHLSGDEDVMWKYVYLARRLFATYENLDAASFRKAIQVLYPSRPKEIYDQMELELVAFSKNRFCRETVEEHLLHMLRTGIEPNQKLVSMDNAARADISVPYSYRPFFDTTRQFHHLFKKSDHQEQGVLSYDDFEEALSALLPSASGRVKRARYNLAQLEVTTLAPVPEGDTTSAPPQVPVERLAMIAAYVSLHGCFVNNWAPQALMNTDLVNEAYYTAALPSQQPQDEGRQAELLAAVNDDASARAEMQADIDSMLNSDGFRPVVHPVDQAAVEEEAIRMAHRISLLQRMENLDDEADDDDTPIRRFPSE